MPRPSGQVSPDDIRTLFSRAMSRMYQQEVPHYAALLQLVRSVNDATLAETPALAHRLAETGETGRLDLERHGAVRVATADELQALRRLFAVMGMSAVGYYDLSVAGVPVHSTAFRPDRDDALRRNPFRIFTSLLRLDLIRETQLRETASAILARRSILTPRCIALIDRAETDGGLDAEDAPSFVAAALETFRWHGRTTVDRATYERLRAEHPLVADVVCFKGPHINHLTPRTLDIDAAQARMQQYGLEAKAVIEGPPARRVPILLRQTSFKALREPVDFTGADGQAEAGAHTARFGEIEQRGLALTARGRALYDRMLDQAMGADGLRTEPRQAPAAAPDATTQADRLKAAFAGFPDDETQLRRQGLGFFRYRLAETQTRRSPTETCDSDVETLLTQGRLLAEPITYEDFLPVSAAGIFRSNLGGGSDGPAAASSDQAGFEQALGATVVDPMALYARAEQSSLHDALARLGVQRPD